MAEIGGRWSSAGIWNPTKSFDTITGICLVYMR